MSIKGVVGPLRLSVAEATVAAAVIAERTAGVDLSDTPLAALPDFGRKLGKAVKRRRRDKAATRIVLWTVTRDEARAGYSYLMLFSHRDAPNPGLSNAELDALHSIALEILKSLIAHKGAEKLSVDEAERRLRMYSPREATDPDPMDERWMARLRVRVEREHALFQQLNAEARAPIPDFARPILARRKITGD